MTAFAKYLESAADLSKLKVLDLEEETIDDEYLVHFLAADRSAPRKLFYRTVRFKIPAVKRTALHWTPWEAIEADIGNEHGVIFKVGPYIHVGYPIVSVDSESSVYNVGLAVHRKTSNGWSTAKKSTGSLSIATQINKSATGVMAISKLPPETRIQPVAKILIHAPDRSSAFVYDAQEQEYERATEGSRLTDLTLQIRMLERIRDRHNNTFYRPMNVAQSLQLDFSIAGEFTTETGGRHTHLRAGGFQFGPAKVGRLMNPPDNSYRWVTSITITAKGDSARHTTATKILKAERNLGSSGKWITDIIFDVRPGVRIEEEFDPERSLELDIVPQGRFDVPIDLGIALGDC